MTFNRTAQFAARPIAFLDLIERDDWRIKIYSIIYGDVPLDRAVYAEGLEIALKELPRPAVTSRRPGVGFAICHQGNGWHYLVMNWWDNENELPQHVYVRPIEATPNSSWNRAGKGHSICVWDIQIINFERDAYVKHVLSCTYPDLTAYTSARL